MNEQTIKKVGCRVLQMADAARHPLKGLQRNRSTAVCAPIALSILTAAPSVLAGPSSGSSDGFVCCVTVVMKVVILTLVYGISAAFKAAKSHREAEVYGDWTTETPSPHPPQRASVPAQTNPAIASDRLCWRADDSDTARQDR